MYTITLFDRQGTTRKLKVESINMAIFNAKTSLFEEPFYNKAIIVNHEGENVAMLKSRKDKGSDLFWMENGKWVKVED